MKKYIPAVLFALLAVILLTDCLALYPRVDWSPDASATSGIGLYLFGGLLEVSEQLPYSETPGAFRGLCGCTAVTAGLALLCFFFARRKTD